MSPKTFIAACCLVLIGTGFYFAPDNVTDRIRGTVIDMLRPGLQAVRLTRSRSEELLGDQTSSFRSGANDQSEVQRLTQALEIEQDRNRALQIRLAQLSERQLPEQEIFDAIARTDRLVQASLVEVAVLGDTTSRQWRAGKLLDQGSKNGLREDELVISTRKSAKPLIDCGADTCVSVGDALLLGRCVIGKIQHVGRWTSTFQLVTDAQYTGRAQLIRESTDGLFVFEAQGILKGQGDALCKLEGIPAESSVRVGDAVYTAERDGVFPTPLYYGKVVEATLETDAREWTVFVSPAPLPSHLTTVQVIKTDVNPARLAVK